MTCKIKFTSNKAQLTDEKQCQKKLPSLPNSDLKNLPFPTAREFTTGEEQLHKLITLKQFTLITKSVLITLHRV